MTTENYEAQPQANGLHLIPPDQLPAKARRNLNQFAKELDRVGRLDPQTQEAYIDEASFRKVLAKHLPPPFVDRLIPMIQDLDGGRDLLRTATSPRKARGAGTVVTWETVATHKGMRVKQAETFEGLGLHQATTMQEIRNALKPHLPNVPDDLFSPALGDRMRQAIDRLADGSGTERSATNQAYWEAFHRCFAHYTNTWVAATFAVFLTAFVIVLLATGNPIAATLAGLAYAAISIPVWFLIGAVHCFVAAAFA